MHPIQGGSLSPFQITLYLGQRVRTTRGQTLSWRSGLVPTLPKRGLVVRKVVTPKTVSPVHKGDGLQAFAWKQSRPLPPFINIDSGPKHKKTIFNTSALGEHEK